MHTEQDGSCSGSSRRNSDFPLLHQQKNNLSFKQYCSSAFHILPSTLLLTTAYCPLSSQFKTIQVHHFVPGIDKIVNEFLLSIVASVDLCKGT